MDITSVALDREAYNLLKSHKRPGESFSQVVKRLAGKPRPLASFAGAWKDMPEKLFHELMQNRKRERQLEEQRFRRLFGEGG